MTENHRQTKGPSEMFPNIPKDIKQGRKCMCEVVAFEIVIFGGNNYPITVK